MGSDSGRKYKHITDFALTSSSTLHHRMRSVVLLHFPLLPRGLNDPKSITTLSCVSNLQVKKQTLFTEYDMPYMSSRCT